LCLQVLACTSEGKGIVDIEQREDVEDDVVRESVERHGGWHTGM
jgi:hypothetical protein